MRQLIEAEDGISLVEMLVAILVLGIILAGLAQSLVASVVAVGRQEVETIATALANEAIEDLWLRDWRDVALCTSDALATFSSASHDGRPLVLLSDSDARCATSPLGAVEASTAGVTRGDATFDLTRAVTWHDDLGDDTGAADPSGQDVKWVTVEVSWDWRGRARSVASETKLAPPVGQQEMTTELVPDDGEQAVYLDGNGENREAFELRASTVHEFDSVGVSWTGSDTETITVALTTSDGGFTWTDTVKARVGPFLNGETLFTFTGTRTVGSETVKTTVVDRGLFLHDLAFAAAGLDVPTAILVDPFAQDVCDFTLGAEIQGVLLSDDVQVQWTDSSGAVVEWVPGVEGEAMLADTATSTGAAFTLPYGGEPGSVPPALAIDTDVNSDGEIVYDVPPPLTLTVTVTRIVDSESASVSAAVPVEGVASCPA